MTAPQFASPDDDTLDLLSLIADDPRVEADYRRFLDACQRAARWNDGLVHVNTVRSLLTNPHNGDLTIEPRRLSAFWNKATGDGRPMRRTGEWEICSGSSSGNDGRPQPVRRWHGEGA